MRPRSRRCVCRPTDKAAPAPTAPQAGAHEYADKYHYRTSRGPANGRSCSRREAGNPIRAKVGPMAAQIGMFPLSTVLFPHAEIPLHVFEPRYRALMRDCLAGDSRFGIVLIERGSEVGGGDQRMSVGTRAVITKSVELSDGRWLLLVKGEARLRIVDWVTGAPYPSAMVEEWPTDGEAVDSQLLERAVHTVRRTRGLLSESGRSAPLSPEVTFEGDAETASWRLCAEAPLNLIDAQQVLAAGGAAERLELIVSLVEALEQDLHRMLTSG